MIKLQFIGFNATKTLRKHQKWSSRVNLLSGWKHQQSIDSAQLDVTATDWKLALIVQAPTELKASWCLWEVDFMTVTVGATDALCLD